MIRFFLSTMLADDFYQDYVEYEKSGRAYRVYLYAGFALLVWTFFIVFVAYLQFRTMSHGIMDIAKYQAYASFSKDLVYRRWAAIHGGVYVPISEKTPPNPYLAHIPERDISTPSGRKLTLVNPAYMTRQVHELGAEDYDVKGHITSLMPLRPENAPDLWERQALESFERGDQEKSGLSTIDGRKYYRYIHALTVEESCLKCHAHQGYRVGDVRGGISVSLPMDKLNLLLAENQSVMIVIFVMLWFLGGGTILVVTLAIRKRFLERRKVQDRIQRQNEDLQATNEELQAAMEELQATNEEFEVTNHDLLATHNSLMQREMELEKARQGADAANRAKSEFLANMSHEIRTPLNAIVGTVDLILQTKLSEEQKELFRVVDVSSDLLLSVIENILDFSRIEVRGVTLEKTAFSLSEIVENLLLIQKLAAEDKGLALTHEIDAIDNLLLGDPTRIQQVLINLINNAIKYTESGSISVIIRVVEETNQLLVIRAEIKDSGIGIEPDKIETIFRPFEQIDSSFSRRYGGAGLGLAICQRLVGLMGGEIGVNSVFGQGTTFWFTLPLDKGDSSNALKSIQPVTRVPLIESAKKGRILLAEDNKVNQMITMKMLANFGYQVETANNGLEAVTAVQRTDFDLVLMDIQMPEMDGLAAASAIRQLPKQSARLLPIIALTAHATGDDKEKCLAAGMSGYLTKPVRQGELAKVISQWVG